MKPSGDIYSTLFSENAVLQKLSSIFVDSMVVDNDLNITVVSENILSILGFTMAELRGKSLDYLSDEEGLVAAIRKQLITGHFSERRFTLLTKKRNKITFGISGFYLGLISDINGRIILRMSTADNSEEVNHKLQAKILEMDNFVYRAGHDLRGPLATIKGLVNLMKIRDNNDEIDRVMQLIEAHANQLDERLFQLMYLTYSGQDVTTSPEVIDFNAIETRLRQIIEKNAFIDFLELHFHAPGKNLRGLKTDAVMGLFENLLLYILSLPMHDFQRQIFFRIQQEENNLHVTIGCNGFLINDKLRTAFESPDFTYADMMRYPEMINFYAAQKIAMQLNSRIRVNIVSDDKQQIMLSIPVPLPAAGCSPVAAT